MVSTERTMLKCGGFLHKSMIHEHMNIDNIKFPVSC